MRLKKSFAALQACLVVALMLLTASAQGAFAAGANASPAKVRAAFVLLGGVNDQGWNAAHHDGIMHLKEQLGQRVEVSYTENIATDADATAKQVIAKYNKIDIDYDAKTQHGATQGALFR